jgi:hypothetical protein
MDQFGAVESGGFNDGTEIFRFSPELVYDRRDEGGFCACQLV